MEICKWQRDKIDALFKTVKDDIQKGIDMNDYGYAREALSQMYGYIDILDSIGVYTERQTRQKMSEYHELAHLIKEMKNKKENRND